MHVREADHEVAREFARSTYAQVLDDVPAALFPYWAQTSQPEFPSIPRDASFFAQSAEGLMMFFDCAAAARKTCALPSRAADSVWHAWMRLDEVGLHRFCIRHFGKIIPHVQKATMGAGMHEALAVCLAQARRRASQPAAGTHLPRLFSLDRRLGMPHGFAYWIIGGLVAYCVLDEFGNPDHDMVFPEALRPDSLVLLGLDGTADYHEAAGRAQRRERDQGGADGPVSVMDIDGCADGDGAASGDGGGSCGGGCGGGCGGS